MQELSTPAKGEKAENVDEEEDADGSVSQSLARLYQKATRAGLRVTKAIKMKFYVGINMLKGLKIGLGELDLKIHQLPIQQLELEHTAKSLNIFRELQKQICVRKPRKQGIYTRCL